MSMEDDPILTAGEDLSQLHIGRAKSHQFLPGAEATRRARKEPKGAITWAAIHRCCCCCQATKLFKPYSVLLPLCALQALNQTVKHGSSTVTALLPALVWMADLIEAK